MFSRFELKDVFESLTKRISSQALLFALAAMLVLVVAWNLDDTRSVIVVTAILAIFVVALAGYLFVERKGGPRQVEGVSAGKDLATISNAQKDFDLRVWTTPLGGADEAASRDVTVIPKTAHGTYIVGQKIAIGFRSSRDCYLTLLNIGTSGKLTILFPNSVYPDNFVRAGQVHVIPDESYGFDYELHGPPGTERLKAIATLKPVSLLESYFSQNGSLFLSVDTEAISRDISIVKKKLDSLRPTEWAEAYCEFKVTT